MIVFALAAQAAANAVKILHTYSSGPARGPDCIGPLPGPTRGPECTGPLPGPPQRSRTPLQPRTHQKSTVDWTSHLTHVVIN